jgi:hypothetical protein
MLWSGHNPSQKENAVAIEDILWKPFSTDDWKEDLISDWLYRLTPKMCYTVLLTQYNKINEHVDNW